MTHLEDRHYTSDENKVFVRISDGTRMGTDMYLGAIDNIENYTEEDMTEEEVTFFENLKKEEEERFKEMEEKFKPRHKKVRK